MLGRVALTYLCVLAGSVVFRADTLHGAGAMLAGMTGLHGFALPTLDGATLRGWAMILGLGAIAFLAPNTQQIMAEVAPVLEAAPVSDRFWAWRPTLGWAAALGCLGALGLLAIGQPSEFLYFQF